MPISIHASGEELVTFKYVQIFRNSFPPQAVSCVCMSIVWILKLLLISVCH